MTNSFMDRVGQIKQSITDNLKYFGLLEIERASLVIEMVEKLEAIDDYLTSRIKTLKQIDVDRHGGDDFIMGKLTEVLAVKAILDDTKE